MKGFLSISLLSCLLVAVSNQAVALEVSVYQNDIETILEDENTATSSNMVWNSMTQNPLGIIQSYRRGNIYRERMNKLLQLKNQIPIDVFLIVFVACQAQDDIVNQ